MRVVVTGTPGTGKTTATSHVGTSLRVIHLNDVIEAHEFITGTDPERGSWIADLGAVRDWFIDQDDVLVESHIAHHLPADRVIVLRCHPETVKRRLVARGDSVTKARENAECEALDLILSEAVSTHGRSMVFEIDTTDAHPTHVANEIDAIIQGDREPNTGTVSFSEYLLR